MNDTQNESRGELELIRRVGRLLEREAGPAGRSDAKIDRPVVGFGDDMCSLDSHDPGLLWTVDMLMDGVDFDSTKHDWEAIGRKAMAVNLSDCAAMAARPLAALCAVSLSNSLSMDDALALLRGAHEFGSRFGCPIVGGDTNSWDAPTAISITVAARCADGLTPVTRDGARVGDRIWLTGQVGGSILGRHMNVEPRIKLAERIARDLGPHAMIDISDGLVLDLWRVCGASGRGAVLEEAALEAAVHPDARRLSATDGVAPREHALYDGEDFELIAVLPADAADAACCRLGLLPLGRIVDEAGLFVEDLAGERLALALRGWEHFR